MGHVIALVDRETGLGYRLAGVEVRETETPGEMERQAKTLFADPAVRLVILDEDLFRGMPRDLQNRLEGNRSPVFVPVPSLPLRKGALRPEEYVARLMRRAVGYQVRIRR